MNLSMITFELCEKAVFMAGSRPSGDLTRLIPTERKRHSLVQSYRVFLNSKSISNLAIGSEIQIEKVAR